MKKRVLYVMLALCLCVGLLFVTAGASGSADASTHAGAVKVYGGTVTDGYGIRDQNSSGTVYVCGGTINSGEVTSYTYGTATTLPAFVFLQRA